MNRNWQLPEILISERFSVMPNSGQIGYQISQYNLPRFTGANIKVGICDTGCDEHDDLPILYGCEDFTNSSANCNDVYGHGTHVAGIVAGQENTIGMLGVAPDVDLVIAKAIGDSGGGTDDEVANAISYCIDSGCQIINLSMSAPNHIIPIAQQIIRATRSGILVVAAAGNGPPSQGYVGFPGRMKETITVGAIDRNKEVAPFSLYKLQHGYYGVDLCGPGVDILSCYLSDGYARLSGTSMAAPWVTGILALLLEKHDGDAETAKSELFRSCSPLSEDTSIVGRGVPFAEAQVASSDELEIDIAQYNKLRLT